VLGWNNWFTTGCLASVRAAAVACMSAGIAVPISLPLGATSAILGFIAFMTIKTKHKIMSKIIRNEKVIILASSKINSISQLVSKIINDSDVTDDEYKLVVQEYEIYQEMKKKRKTNNPVNARSDKDIFGKEFQEKFSTDLKNLLSTINHGQANLRRQPGV